MSKIKTSLICPNCQQLLVQAWPFCPHCGQSLTNLDATLLKRLRRRAAFRRWLLPLILLLIVIAFGILGLALKGFRDGAADQQAAKQQQAQMHYNLGMVWMQCEQYQMAEAEFQEALRLLPEDGNIQSQWRLAQARQTVTPTSTPPPPTATATAVAAPTPTPLIVVHQPTEVLFEEATRFYQNKDWENAIAQLSEIRRLDSSYKADEVIEMLVQSHVQYAATLEEAGSMVDAISHYDDALKLAPRDLEIKTRRRLADLYQSALDYWEMDWEQVLINLTPLYNLKPDYKDVADRLYQASVTRAGYMIDQQRWCNAAKLYEQALNIYDQDDLQIVDIEGKTKKLCAAAPPPPPLGSESQAEWPPQGQVHIGTLVSACYDYETNQSHLCLINAVEQTLKPWLSLADQPALTLDGTMLAWRSTDPTRPGLYAAPVISLGAVISSSQPVSPTDMAGGMITVTTDIEAQYPAWSRDGQRVAFASYDNDKKDWFIYVFDVRSKTLRRIQQGNWPDWGNGDWVSFTACDSANKCGIRIYDLKTQEMHMLTASSRDQATVWAPSAQELVYMSDVDGISLDLYGVRTDGWVRRITYNLSVDAMPAWSPDGQRVAYVTNHRNRWAIYTVHPWGGQEEQIAVIGAISAEWSRFRLAWIAPVIRLTR